MERINDDEIKQFLKTNVVPIEDAIYGNKYRASVTLVDGLVLPCVLFKSSDKLIDLAIRRFDEEKKGKGVFQNKKTAYREIVKTFVAGNNRISSYNISKIEISKNAFPVEILKQIHGETTMGWTGFVIKMKDGKCFPFGTTFSFEFFEMPENYEINDIKEIINHSFIDTDGNLQKHDVPFFKIPAKYNRGSIYKDKPYFECYLEGI